MKKLLYCFFFVRSNNIIRVIIHLLTGFSVKFRDKLSSVYSNCPRFIQIVLGLFKLTSVYSN